MAPFRVPGAALCNLGAPAFGRVVRLLLWPATVVAMTVGAITQGWALSVHPTSAHHAEEILAPTEQAPDPNDTDPYSQYLRFKEQLQDSNSIEYGMLVTALPQWGTPNGGPGIVNSIYAPSLVWNPFSDTTLGSGSFGLSFLKYQFWTAGNAVSQAAFLGVNTLPSDWGINGYEYSQVTYTHKLPGDWLSVTVGQYTFGAFDTNEYASDAQLNFVNMALTQNATQAYPNAGLGAYAQATLANKQLILAGGFQGATDITGSVISTQGFATGKYAYFASAQLTPQVLPGATLGLLWYTQPAVLELPSKSDGFSINAVQNIGADWGLFLRANHASGTANSVETAIAGGMVRHNVLARDKKDELGFGMFWSKTNFATLTAVLPNVVELDAAPSEPDNPMVRGAEWGLDLYYRYSISRGLQVSPDLQIYFNPAFSQGTSPVAVFTIRSTLLF